MDPLPLADLPKHSAWAEYLLDPAGEPPDDPEAYTGVETYDDTYAHLLEEYRASSVAPETFALRIRATGRADPGPISIREDLFLASPAELVERERTVVCEALAPVVAGAETVVDLGCGRGATLGTIADASPDVTVVGGEYSAHGVELARELHADTDRISVERFDFRDDWELLDAVAADTLLFTNGALSTLSDLAQVVDQVTARARAGDVIGGVHLEHVDVHPGTVLGLLRRHYGRVRGYNGELLGELERHDAVTVTEVAYDVVGPNPLCPLTAVRWRPA